MKDFSGADLIADALAQMEVEHVFAIVEHSCHQRYPIWH